MKVLVGNGSIHKASVPVRRDTERLVHESRKETKRRVSGLEISPMRDVSHV